jgi:hypothetical protein
VRSRVAAGVTLLALTWGASWIWLTSAAPDTAFVRQRGEAMWIEAPLTPRTGVVPAPREALPWVDFERELELERRGTLELRIEALRGFELYVDGRRVAMRRLDEGSWRQATETALELPVGVEEVGLRLRVRNPTGPALLRVTGRAGDEPVVTDTRWTARLAGGERAPARRADDRLRAPEARTGRVVTRALRQRASLLIGMAAAGALAWGLLRGRARPGLHAAALGGLATLWAWLLLGKFTAIPAYMGFDGPDHLAYVRYVLETRSLPLAHEGPQFYQPPLYYVLQATLLGAFGDGPARERLLLHLLPFACGVVQIVAAWALARTLLPADRTRAASAALAAGCLPLNLYMAAYPTNETLYGALGAMGLVATCRLLTAERVSVRATVALGALLGLAILTKASGLLWLLLAAGALGVRLAGIERRPAAMLGAVALLGASALLVGGGPLLRNQLHYGQALFTNWTIPGHAVEGWQHPGFHTPDYYLRFGAVLERPFFASFESVWDGLYATLWGDGLIGGLVAWRFRHAHWDWEWMAAIYALALPATALLGVGLLSLFRRALRYSDSRRRLAAAFALISLVVLVSSVLFASLVLPAYSMAHARYLLAATPLLAVALAEGFVVTGHALPGRWGRAVQVGLHAWAAAFVLAVIAAFAA